MDRNKELNPYSTEKITEDSIELFIDRENELKYVVDSVISERYAAIPVLGEVGTGKTSFLNVVKFYLEKRGIKARIVSAEDILQRKVSKDGVIIERGGGVISENRAMVLLVDDIEKASEERAKEIYDRLGVMKSHVKIVFTGKKSWSKEVKEKIDEITTDLEVNMKVSPEKMAFFMTERLKRAGKENRFEHEAFVLAGKRANLNLRAFFKYCRIAAHLQRGGSITFGVMRDTILADDLNHIGGMDDLKRGIMYVLITEGEMTNEKLMKSLKKTMGRFKDTLYYKAREYLQRKGFIIVRKEGFRTIVKDVYRELGIEVPPEAIKDPEFYAMKIRDSYVRSWGEKKRVKT